MSLVGTRPPTVDELNNYLDKLTIMSVKDSSKISNVKRMIIRNVLTKYYDEEKGSLL